MRACLAFVTDKQLSVEHLQHGFLRRLGTLQGSIEKAFSIYPPERNDFPSRSELVDLAINLQAFIFNVFGSIDNLAWVWAAEKQLALRPMDVALNKQSIRSTLPPDFCAYL
jgi:hypothetical protein